MCVAIVCSPKTMLTPKQLWAGWSGNPDGAGFAFVKDGKVEIKKGYLKYNPFQKAYMEAAEKYADTSAFLVHMRIRTSGNVSEKNCHPFPIKGGALIHNGILFSPTGDQSGSPKDRKSDTRIFAENLYNILALEDMKRARQDLEKAVGWGNKIAFLYDNGEYMILNEDQGDWDHGIWFSNSSCSTTRYDYGTPGAFD